MRITSVTIRNYRIHRELKVELDPSLTLIGGPNESGKSTLVEAVHRALFLKSRITGEIQRSMVSRVHAGHPEVEVCFEAGGESYRIVKRFSGASGTSQLAACSGAAWQGDEAETRLAEILGVDAAAGGRAGGDRAAQQWAHLWVWQGRAGDNPSEHATTQKDALLARLQGSGGAAVMQSEFDAAVAGHIARQYESLFTRNGSPKRDSDLHRVTQEVESARQALADAQAALIRLQQAVAASQEAGKTIRNCERLAGKLRADLAEVEAKLAAVAALQQEEQVQGPAAEAAIRNHEALTQGDTRIEKMRTQIQRCQVALAPRLTELESHARREAECTRQVREAEETCQSALADLRAARLRHELAAAHAALFQKTAERDALVNRLNQVQQVRAHLAAIERALADVPVISAADLKSVQKQEGRCATAEAALQAMAAGIDVLAADRAVHVGGKTLTVGQSEVLTEETQIAIGRSIRLQVRPGGGSSLAEARGQLQDARHALRQALDKLRVDSTAAAAETCARRQQLEAELKADRAELAGLGADTIDNDVAAARNAQLAAEAEVTQRASLLHDFTPPTSAADAGALVAHTAELLRAAESHESSGRNARDLAARNLQEASSALRDLRREVQQEELQQRDLSVQLRVLVDEYGDDADRGSRLAALQAARASAEGQLALTRRQLEALQPPALARDKTRLDRALAQCESDLHDAKTQQAVASNTLWSDGSVDPQEACDFAAARLRAAEDRFTSVQRRAQAVQLLHQLFLAEQRALADQFTRPFAEKIAGYLQCLFGASAHVHVRLEQNAFAGLEFVSPAQRGDAFSFESLSAGTKEQVAAAVRLAMAEVLAENSDHCLPVIFDDAFAYSDPDRVAVLQRMLDRAAARGLQIIVLSCNPSDYVTLGARSVLLREESGLPP